MRTGLRVFALGAALAAGECSATTITATDLTTWKSDLTGSPTDVDSSSLRIGNSYNTAAGVVLSGFTFTGPDGSGYKLMAQQYSGYTSLFGATDSGAGINVTTTAGGKNALAFGVASTSGTPLALTFSDGEAFSVSGSTGFFGVAFSHPVTSFFVSTSAGSQVVIKYVSYGSSAVTQDSSPSASTSAVPEAGTLALFGLGLFLLALSKRVPKAQTPQPFAV